MHICVGLGRDNTASVFKYYPSNIYQEYNDQYMQT